MARRSWRLTLTRTPESLIWEELTPNPLKRGVFWTEWKVDDIVSRWNKLAEHGIEYMRIANGNSIKIWIPNERLALIWTDVIKWMSYYVKLPDLNMWELAQLADYVSGKKIVAKVVRLNDGKIVIRIEKKWLMPLDFHTQLQVNT